MTKILGDSQVNISKWKCLSTSLRACVQLLTYCTRRAQVGTTLVIDASQNRVGINTESPTTELDVAGTITGTGLDINGNTDIHHGNNLADFQKALDNKRYKQARKIFKRLSDIEPTNALHKLLFSGNFDNSSASKIASIFNLHNNSIDELHKILRSSNDVTCCDITKILSKIESNEVKLIALKMIYNSKLYI